ncbi:MAG: right-handed parallel beta-helix repeat-containing protein [Deltaproteobacteria bacterium]|nr:right-handed parallel beta-helix repeat-containing protein [Deltaproteobacteria bacterium]
MRGIFSLTALVLAVPAFAADRYVDDAGTDTGACTTVGSPCETIAYALGQATAGDTVHVDAGTYSSTGLSFKGSITIQGAGSTAPQSLLTGTGGDIFDFASASGTITIQGFAIQHSGGEAFEFLPANDAATIALSDIDATLSGGQSYAGVYFYANTDESVTLEVTNSTFTNHQTGVLGYAYYADVMDVTLTNTTTTGTSLEGLYLSVSGNTADTTQQTDLSVHVEGSNLDSKTNDPVELYGQTLGGFDLVLSNNTFSASTSYDAVKVKFSDIRAPSIEASIVGNTFRAKDSGSGLQLSASPATSFDATVVMNDNTFEAGSEGVYLYVPDVGMGELTFNGNTLQDNGGNGATLYMWGNDASDSALDLVCQGNTATNNGGDGIYVEISSFGVATMALTGNTLEDNSDAGLELDFSGVGTESRVEATLTGNTVQRNGGYGIDLTLSSYGQGTLRVEGNTVTANSSDQIYLFIDNTSYAPGFLDLQVNDNTVVGSDSGGEGIEIELYGDNTILGSVSGNTVTDAGGAGLGFWISSSSNLVDVTLSNNTLTGNDVGLDIGMSGYYNAIHFDVVGNTITGNDDDGVLIWDWAYSNNLDVDLRSNDISDNGGDGVEIYNYYGAFTGRFYGNLIRGNDENGIYVYSSGTDGFFLEATHNTISGNAGGYANSGYYDIDASYLYYQDMLAYENWWGTEDTGVIADHIYDPYYGEVLYSALSDTLAFEVAAPSGPAAGGTQLLIRATDDVTRFVPSVPGHPLSVTFGSDAATDLSISNDGRWLWVTIPAHAPGNVTVTVTNPGGQSGTTSFEYLAAFVDADEDGVEDSVDNCLGLANPEQGDFDDDDLGDACDTDDDGDGEPDATDNCPFQANADQSDLDEDTIGDACDSDADGDDVADAEDNCLGMANTGQADMDSDGIGDACDNDADGDGVADIDQVAEPDEDGCGCATSPAPATGWLLVGLLGLLRRRRAVRVRGEE